MKKQVLFVGAGNTVAFETPEGVVKVQRINSKRLLFIMPDGMTAHSDPARAKGRFVDGDGRPLYSIIEPTTDGDGKLTGVTMPPVFKAV